MLAEILTSHSRAEIMRILFDGAGEEYYLREIEKLTNVGLNSLQKEVKHLTSIDLIKARKDGNRIYYHANKEHPLYLDLISIVEKTVGVVSLLRQRLKDPRVQCAFIFGSVAKEKEKAQSDIDIIIIGNLGMREVSKLLSGLQEMIGREINPHVYSEDAFQDKLAKNDHFLTSVLKQKIKPILGDINEYRKSH
jgi:predicted nucleotidyltransferase